MHFSQICTSTVHVTPSIVTFWNFSAVAVQISEKCTELFFSVGPIWIYATSCAVGISYFKIWKMAHNFCNNKCHNGNTRLNRWENDAQFRQQYYFTTWTINCRTLKKMLLYISIICLILNPLLLLPIKSRLITTYPMLNMSQKQTKSYANIISILLWDF